MDEKDQCPHSAFVAPQLTFNAVVAGYEYEGAHSIYRLVHSFRPLLAHCIARRGPSAAGVAGISAIPPARHYLERGICLDSRFIVFARATVWLEKSLNSDRVRARIVQNLKPCKKG